MFWPHGTQHKRLQQQGDDAGATVNETVEEGNEWAANDDEDPDNWLQEEHEEVNEGNANEVLISISIIDMRDAKLI